MTPEPETDNSPRHAPLSVLGGLALSSLAAHGGTLTIDNGSLSVDSPDATSISLIPFSVVPFSYDGGAAVKLSGDQTFTATTTGPIQIVVSFTGSATAAQNDKFSIGYDFTDFLTGTGSVTPSIAVNAVLFGIFPVGAGGSLPPGGAGTTPYSGFFVSAPAPIGATANYTASATFDWTGATVGDTLRISVPTNSIDFAVSPTPLPEPGAIGLLLLAAPMLGLLRRRARIA